MMAPSVPFLCSCVTAQTCGSSIEARQVSGALVACDKGICGSNMKCAIRLELMAMHIVQNAGGEG
jgi:hypothetical protein